MSYHISMGLEAVKLQASRAIEALGVLQVHRSGDAYTDERMLSWVREEVEAVDRGEKSPAEALLALLEGEDFAVEASDGFLCLTDWAEDGYGKTCDEDWLLVGLGDLFEPGGKSWGDGEQGERWEYRFRGGSYELGWAPSGLWVSRGDKERVRGAFARLQGPPDALETIKAFLERADVKCGTENDTESKGAE